MMVKIPWDVRTVIELCKIAGISLEYSTKIALHFPDRVAETENTNIARQLLKAVVDGITTKYINDKITELNEDFMDITSELQFYNSKSELTEYESARKQFILAIFDWKEKVWAIEEQIEEQIDSMSEEELQKFADNYESLVVQRYEKELTDVWNNVVSLQV